MRGGSGGPRARASDPRRAGCRIGAVTGPRPRPRTRAGRDSGAAAPRAPRCARAFRRCRCPRTDPPRPFRRRGSAGRCRRSSDRARSRGSRRSAWRIAFVTHSCAQRSSARARVPSTGGRRSGMRRWIRGEGIAATRARRRRREIRRVVHAKAADHVPDLGKHRACQRLGLLERASDLARRRALQLEVRDLEVQRERGEVVADHVVELAGDPKPLGGAAAPHEELPRRALALHQVRHQDGERLKAREGQRVGHPDRQGNRKLRMVARERDHQHRKRGRLHGDPGRGPLQVQPVRDLPGHEDQGETSQVRRPPPVHEQSRDRGDGEQGQARSRCALLGPSRRGRMPGRRSRRPRARPRRKSPSRRHGWRRTLRRRKSDDDPCQEAGDPDGARDRHPQSLWERERGRWTERYTRGACLPILVGPARRTKLAAKGDASCSHPPPLTSPGGHSGAAGRPFGSPRDRGDDLTLLPGRRHRELAELASLFTGGHDVFRQGRRPGWASRSPSGGRRIDASKTPLRPCRGASPSWTHRRRRRPRRSSRSTRRTGSRTTCR